MHEHPLECHHNRKVPIEMTSIGSSGRDLQARHVIAVMSGKGGVGKSTVAVNLACALKTAGQKVGIVDADVYGPNVPRMLGLTRKQFQRNWMVWRNPARGRLRLEPVEILGLKVMSAGFIMAEEQPVAWSATWVRMLLNQLVFDTLWNDLDYLVIDLPPGTGDIQQEILESVPLAGVVLVTTSQDVSHLDLRKALTVTEAASVPVLGVVENMSGVKCPDCGSHFDLYPRTGTSRAAMSALGPALRLPFEPGLAQLAEQGRSVANDADYPELSIAFKELADQVQMACERHESG